MLERQEKIIEDNIEFIGKFDVYQLLSIMKTLYINHKLFLNEAKVKIINDANNFKVKYENGKIKEIEIVIDFNEPYKEIKLDLNSCYIDFSKYNGHGTWEVENRIPIYALRLINELNNN